MDVDLAKTHWSIIIKKKQTRLMRGPEIVCCIETNGFTNINDMINVLSKPHPVVDGVSYTFEMHNCVIIIDYSAFTIRVYHKKFCYARTFYMKLLSDNGIVPYAALQDINSYNEQLTRQLSDLLDVEVYSVINGIIIHNVCHDGLYVCGGATTQRNFSDTTTSLRGDATTTMGEYEFDQYVNDAIRNFEYIIPTNDGLDSRD